MIRKGWLYALIVIVIVNAIVLVGVLRNRTGEPDAVVILTERELPMAYVPEENTGIALRLDWSRYDSRLDWLDTSKLEELGFDCDEPIDAKSEEIHYAKQLPREAFAVLEYGGDAWEAWLSGGEQDLEDLAAKVERGEAVAADLDRATDSFERDKSSRSRLFAVDAGTEARILRQRYADRGRFIVVPAVIQIQVDHGWGDDPRDLARLSGRIRVLVHDIHVAGHHREPLDGLSHSTDSNDEPRYTVTLAFGRRHEPWILELQSIE